MKRWLLILAAIVALTALSLASPLATTAKAGPRGLDPTTQRYVAVLKTNLTALAKASEKEHIPCYHAPKAPGTPQCRRLHADVGAATKKTLKALSTLPIPKKLRRAHTELKAALEAYLARVNLDLKALDAGDIQKFRGTHESLIETRLNNAITRMIALVPGAYLPIVG